MVIALITVWYILGFIFSYRFIRGLIRNKRDEDWITIEKMMAVGLSFLSWLILIGFLAIIIIDKISPIDFEKKRKW